MTEPLKLVPLDLTPTPRYSWRNEQQGNWPAAYLVGSAQADADNAASVISEMENAVSYPINTDSLTHCQRILAN